MRWRQRRTRARAPRAACRRRPTARSTCAGLALVTSETTGRRAGTPGKVHRSQPTAIAGWRAILTSACRGHRRTLRMQPKRSARRSARRSTAADCAWAGGRVEAGVLYYSFRAGGKAGGSALQDDRADGRVGAQHAGHQVDEARGVRACDAAYANPGGRPGRRRRIAGIHCMYVACCVGMPCILHVARCMMRVACCVLHVARCALRVAWECLARCMLHPARPPARRLRCAESAAHYARSGAGGVPAAPALAYCADARRTPACLSRPSCTRRS